MNLVTIYIPYISRSMKKDDIINIFQDGIGMVENIMLLTDKSNSFCDCCKSKSEHVERCSCDVCLLRSKNKQVGAYVRVNLNTKNETAHLIMEAFGRNNVYNLSFTRYSDYDDRVTNIFCLTKTQFEFPDKLGSVKLRSGNPHTPPNTPTNSVTDEPRDNVLDLFYDDYDSELDSNHKSVAGELSDSTYVLRCKLHESTQLLSVRDKQIEETKQKLAILTQKML
jgi:hypothetical protein